MHKRQRARVGLPVLLVLTGLLAVISVSPLADEADDAIQDVILTQIEAFANDDELAAWEQASEGIQRRFRSPETFLRMVRLVYPPVHRATAIRFRQRVPHDHFDIQVVRLQGPEGRLWDAYYRVVPVEQGWKVGGVRLLPVDMGI